MDNFFTQCHYLDNDGLPPGFKFHPTDEELITCYLLRKVLDGTFTCRAIADVDLNKCEPWELPQRAKLMGKEWYFFSLRDRKYPTGLRTNRATEAGYWKATGKDREIYSSKTSSLVGMKKTLVFYRGRAPKGEKSNWVMHEYRLDGKLDYHFLSKTSTDEWVICRVFEKSSPGGTKREAIRINPYQEVNSSTTSFTLPSLIDSSYTSSTSAYTAADNHDCYSYDSNAASKEHVPCFSNFNTQTILDLPPPPLSAATFSSTTMYHPTNVGVSASFPLFYSAPPQQPNLFGGNWLPVVSTADEIDQKPGPTELDCIWSF